MTLHDLNWSLSIRVGAALLVLVAIDRILEVPTAARIAMFGAAFATSTGARWNLGGRRLPIVVLDLAGKAAGFIAGWVAAQVPIWNGLTLVLPGLALCAAVVGALNLAHRGLWWIGVQCFVFFGIGGFLAGNAPSPVSPALHIIAAGMFMALWLDIPWLRRRPGAPQRPGGESIVVPRFGDALRGALIASASVGLSYALAIAAGLTHAYWAPLAGLVVLKPDHLETREFVIRRTVFTIVGVAAATALVLAVPPGHHALYGLFVVSAMATAAVNGLEFRYFVCGLSATAILLVTMGNSAIVANAEQRVVATMIGGVVAVAVSRLVADAARRRTGPPAS
jgi:hypothetical protein